VYCALLVGEVINLGSEVDFVIESGLHVLTSRTISPVYQRQLSFVFFLSLSFQQIFLIKVFGICKWGHFLFYICLMFYLVVSSFSREEKVEYQLIMGMKEFFYFAFRIIYT
jgi:hypothetical protein